MSSLTARTADTARRFASSFSAMIYFSRAGLARKRLSPAFFRHIVASRLHPKIHRRETLEIGHTSAQGRLLPDPAKTYQALPGEPLQGLLRHEWLVSPDSEPLRALRP